MTMPARPEVFRFDAFEADLGAGELRKEGIRQKLQEQPWQVLVALLERHGQIVTREELRQRLWPTDTFVDFDHGLNIAINKVRDSLDDAAGKPRFIETVPRRGYRFIAPVERIAPKPVGPPESATTFSRSRIARLVVVAGAAVFVLAVAGIVWHTLSSQSPHAIAVLPLQNLKGDSATDYIADGLTDEIIYNLSIIEGLEVKSRTSSSVFKGAGVDLRKAGRQLGCDLLLEGTVLSDGDKLRLHISLVRVADGVAAWTWQSDGGMRDVFAIQEEMSRDIVNQLRLNGIGRLRRYRTDPETFTLYLEALSLSHENAPGHGDQIERAASLLQQVVERDPQFAPARGALAEVYAHWPARRRGGEPIRQRMRNATAQAIALDPLLPQAQATLGLLHAGDLRWQDAETAFRSALEHDPNLATARSEFATFVLEPEGKIQEALAQVRLAVKLDPLSPSRRSQLVFALLRAGQYDEALTIADSVHTDHPDEAAIAQLLGRALLLKGRRTDAIALFEKQGPPSHAYLGYAYAIVGKRHEAEELAAEDDPQATRHQVLIYAGLGDYDRCFDALQQLAKANDVMANIYPGEPELAFLRNDPRMRAFRRQRGLPVNP